MIDDGEQTQARKPVGIDHPALANGLDGGTALGGDQHSVPAHPARTRIAEARHQVAAHRPGELAPQPREGVVPFDREALHGGAQLADQLLEPRLLGAQTLEILSTAAGLGLEAHQHVVAPFARLLEIAEMRALLLLELGELGVLGLEFGIELGKPPHVVLDEADLTGSSPPEVAVVGEHAAGERRILLVEEELERFLSPDEVSRAHLPGERGAVVFELRLAGTLFGGERSATGGVLGALVTNAGERVAGVCHGELRAAQLARQPVALDLLGAHFTRHPLDLRLHGLQLLLGLAGVVRAGCRRRRGEVRRRGEGRNGEGCDDEPEQTVPEPARRRGWSGGRASAGSSRRRAVRHRGAIMRALFRP